MNINLILVLLTLLFIIFAFLFVKARWSEFSVVDLYVVMIVMFFGVYTLVDVIVNPHLKFEPELSVLTLLFVFIPIMLTWAFVMVIPQSIRQYMKFKYLIIKWGQVNVLSVLALFVFVLLIKLYGYLQFGIITNIGQIDLLRLGITLPYWFKSINTLLQPFLLCVFLAGFVKMLSVGKMKSLLWLFLSLAALSLVALSGRRSLFFVFVIAGMVFFIQKRMNIFSVKWLVLVALLGFVFAVFSNLYQNYRNSMSLSRLYQRYETVDVMTAAFDFESTVKNLRTRQSMWRFNYMVLDAQLGEENILPSFGEIAWQAIRNSIPHVMWPDKTVYDLDEMISRRYGFPVVDYPSNDFVFTLADFYCLSIIVLPLKMFFVFFVLDVLLMIVNKHVTLFWLLTGRFVYFIVNVEDVYSAPIIFFRDIFLLGAAYFLLFFLSRLAKWHNIVAARR